MGARRLAGGLVLAAACATTQPRIVETRDIAEAGGAPDIEAIVDLGGGDVPANGTLSPGGSDGFAAIGETLWIRGDSFGKQPTVLVAGRPAAVLSRTEDGGILVRVPPGSPAGPQPVVVSNEQGKGEKPVTIRRIVGVIPVRGGRVGWAEVAHEGVKSVGDTEVLDARRIAMSADGRAAYVAGGPRALVSVIELPHAGQPAPVRHVDLGKGPIVALAAAGRAPALAVVTDKQVTMLETSAPLSPARSAPRSLPSAVTSAKIVRADLSPDGRWLAIGVEDGNRVILLDVGAPGKATLGPEVAVAPEVRAPVIVDLAFSPNGDTVWVLTGDTAASKPSGPQPTRVHAVRLAMGPDAPPALNLARTVQVDEAGDPVRISTGRALPLVSGATVRIPPEKATVYFTASARAGKRFVAYRVGAEDQVAEVAGTDAALGGTDLSPDSRWLLTAAAAPGGVARFLAAPADLRPGATSTIDVGASSKAGPSPVDGVAEIRIQP